MKSLAVAALALGLLCVMATPSMAHEHWDHHHGYYGGTVYYGAPARVVVAPAPVYAYPNYPTVVAPGYPVVVPGGFTEVSLPMSSAFLTGD